MEEVLLVGFGHEVMMEAEAEAEAAQVGSKVGASTEKGAPRSDAWRGNKRDGSDHHQEKEYSI